MSLSYIYELRRIPINRETYLNGESLVYQAFQKEPHEEQDEFTLHTALDLRFLRDWLAAYPEETSEELRKIAGGEVKPSVGRILKILERIDAAIMNRHPDSPWLRYPENIPPSDQDNRKVLVWLYDDDESRAVIPGVYENEEEEDGFGPFPFKDEKGKITIVSHWAPRKEGDAAPVPPPIL